MKKIIIHCALPIVAALTLAGCWGSRYVSADSDLESVYKGRSYYEVVGEFGRPDVTTEDDRGGTMIGYASVSLSGTSAASLYRQYNMRNSLTEEGGGYPRAAIAFFFNPSMRCYSVESDFERERVGAPAPTDEELARARGEVYVKPQVPRTLDFPFVQGRSPYAERVTVEKVVVTADSVNIYFSYMDRTPKHRPLYDKGLAINPDIFLRDVKTGERIKVRRTEGIRFYPEYTPFAHNRGGYDMLVYCVTFEAIPINTKVVDIIEPGPEGFNFYSVDISTPMNFRQVKASNPIPEG
jgi:hypothetical protein